MQLCIINQRGKLCKISRSEVRRGEVVLRQSSSSVQVIDDHVTWVKVPCYIACTGSVKVTDSWSLITKYVVMMKIKQMM